MKIYNLPFRIGHVEFAVHCLSCNVETLVRRPGLLFKRPYPEPTHCPYCGSTGLVIETENAGAQVGENT